MFLIILCILARLLYAKLQKNTIFTKIGIVNFIRSNEALGR